MIFSPTNKTPREFLNWKDEILRLYEDEKKSALSVAKHFNVSEATIRRWLKKYGVRLRSSEEARPREE